MGMDPEDIKDLLLVVQEGDGMERKGVFVDAVKSPYHLEPPFPEGPVDLLSLELATRFNVFASPMR
jgi:hypothetical protein